MGSGTKFASIVAVLCALLFVSPVRGYGEESGGYPDHREREIHFFTNAARCAPTTYRSKTGYGAESDGSLASVMASSSVAPLRYSYNLNVGARAHSKDMASNCGLQHDSCDGTSWDKRILSYFSCSSAGVSENVLYDYYTSGLADVNYWLCDGTSTCAADGSAGHRENILLSTNAYIGPGGAMSGTTYYYGTQDFADSTCSGQPEYGLTTPIYDGVSVTASSTTRFLTTFYSSVAPSAARVVIEGTAYTLSRDMGNSTYGVYVHSETAGTACRKFYFSFVVSGTEYTYPTSGSLVTYGESCTTNYSSSRVNSDGTVTGGSKSSGLSSAGKAAIGVIFGLGIPLAAGFSVAVYFIRKRRATAGAGGAAKPGIPLA